MSGLKIGMQCKACNKPLHRKSIDPELCDECIGIVMACNADLIDKLPATDLEKPEL